MRFEDRLSALLSKGYFPNELPPVFTTHDFGQSAHAVIEEWQQANLFKRKAVKQKKGSATRTMRDRYTYELKDAENEIISKPKRGYERRNISITHPLPQALLTFELASNWQKVQRWLSRQEYSLDEIEIGERFERSIKGINFGIHRAKKSFLEATSDWIVKTDITRFYPSIYTHSIAWAAYGKEKVKASIPTYKGSLADRLDILVRSCNRNQTSGIPIGPETSRILSEIISARIDQEFQRKNGHISKDKIDRLQDDWFLGVSSLESAEKALSSLSSIYREFNLEINGYKTSIDHMLRLSGSYWLSELRAYLSHKPAPLRGDRLREFLDLSLRLQSDNASEPVINYALAVIEGTDVSADDIEALESFLLKSALVSPISMDKICRIILDIQFRTKKLSAARIRSRFTELADRHFEKGNTFEVIWLAYTLRGMNEPLDSKYIARNIAEHSGSALPLVLLDMKHRGHFPRRLPTEAWEKACSDDRVRSDWIWLLAYEGAIITIANPIPRRYIRPRG